VAKAGLADVLPVRRHRLGIDASPAALAAALDRCPDVDTSTLVVLSGAWHDGEALLAWSPARVVTDSGLAHLDDTTHGTWFGWHGFGSGPLARSWFGQFPHVLRREPDETWWFESIGPDAGVSAALEQVVVSDSASEVRLTPREMTAREDHLAAVEQAIAAIRAGDLYQVNICARMRGTLEGEPLELFARGLRDLGPQYAAFVRTPSHGTLVSFSPELFLRRDGRQVVTAPIKGTRRRHVSETALDDPAAIELRHSTKDRAENVMIVDLMRNDLSRVCATGSVRTPDLLSIRPAPGVWHLVSQVSGELLPGVTDSGLLQATFPPGSVTGAPKISALRLIDALESTPRGVFTGAVGFVSPSDRAEFNVAIRTFEIGPADGGKRPFELGVGGGITAESVPMMEWRECLIKASPLLAVAGDPVIATPTPIPPEVDPSVGIFDTMLSVDGRIEGLSDHITRLSLSCLEVYGIEPPTDVLAPRIVRAVRGLTGRHRVRVTVRPGDPEPEIMVSEAAARAASFDLVTVTERSDALWRHKWNDRRWYSELETRVGALPLFVRDGLVLETSRRNVVVLRLDVDDRGLGDRGVDGRHVAHRGVIATHPLYDSILPGVTRRRFLDNARDAGWEVQLRHVSVDELHQRGLVLSLSATGVVPVRSLDGHRLDVEESLLGLIHDWHI